MVPAMTAFAYGPHREQVGDLLLPEGPGPHPVVVLWHGGAFREDVTRAALAPAAADLAARGWAAVNVTYRRLGSGGGWPQTFEDGRAALEHVAQLDASLDRADVTVLGFSAGMPVAAFAARTAVGVRPRRLVNLAGVALLAKAVAASGPASGAWTLLGDPAVEREAFAGADPSNHLPLGIASVTVHGDADELVPLALGERWVQRATAAGDPAELRVVPGAGHFDLHVPGGAGWQAVLDWLNAPEP